MQIELGPPVPDKREAKAFLQDAHGLLVQRPTLALLAMVWVGFYYLVFTGISYLSYTAFDGGPDEFLAGYVLVTYLHAPLVLLLNTPFFLVATYECCRRSEFGTPGPDFFYLVKTTVVTTVRCIPVGIFLIYGLILSFVAFSLVFDVGIINSAGPDLGYLPQYFSEIATLAIVPVIIPTLPAILYWTLKLGQPFPRQMLTAHRKRPGDRRWVTHVGLLWLMFVGLTHLMTILLVETSGWVMGIFALACLVGKVYLGAFFYVMCRERIDGDRVSLRQSASQKGMAPA